MSRIAYLIPAPLDRDVAGAVEVRRRQAVLAAWAAVGTDVVVRCVASGPASIESAYEEILCVPPAARLLVQFERDGFDAVILGCFADPGLDALRELVPMLTVGPAGAAVAAALTLGRRFSVITVGPSVVPALRRVVNSMGCREALASIRYVGMSVAEVNNDHSLAVKKLLDEGRAALEQDGADVLILGCMSMGFLDASQELTRALGVPVLNPVHAVLKHTEGLVSQRLRHSPRAYPLPPRLAAGAGIDDLFIPSKESP